MITLITGAPGAGKTNALVDLLDELAEGRALFVSGIPDLKVPHVDLEDPRKWHETVPDGSAVVIDEVQRVWRPNRGAITEDIAALETHRHRGIDFFVVTQGPNLVHANVRALVGRHVHLRDTGITGRWWYEWPECCESPASKFKQAPVRKAYKLNKKVQGLYTSASLHVKPIRSIPRSVLLVALCVPLAGFLAYRVYSSIQGRLHPQAKESAVARKPSDLPAELARPAVSAGEAASAVTYKAGQVLTDPTAAPAVGGPQLASTVATPVSEAPSIPKGCIAQAERCRCFDGAGMLMDMEPQACRDAINVAGRSLPLDVPLIQQAQDVSPHARSPDPVPINELRSSGSAALSVLSPGERQTQAWQGGVLRDIERM